MTYNPRIVVPAYLLMAVGVLATGMFVIRSEHFLAEPEMLAWAVSIDIAVLLPAIYLFLARKLGWSWTTVIPVFLLAFLSAELLLPAGHHGGLDVLGFIAIPLELFVVGFVIYKVRQINRDYRSVNTGHQDFLEGLEIALTSIMGESRVMQALLTEIAILHYGLFAWRKKPSAEPGGAAFTYHINNSFGAVMSVLVFLILLETTLLHILIARWVEPLAWILTILGIYGVLFLLADFNAARLRPMLIEDRVLKIRVALRWRVSIRLEDIADIRPFSGDAPENTSTLKGGLLWGHNMIIELRRPYAAKGLYGTTKRFERIELAVDDVDGLIKALKEDS